jgi:hypothetical protein
MRAICGGEMDQLHRDLLDDIERLKSAAAPEAARDLQATSLRGSARHCN